jgi:hypothetical protein
MTTAHEPARAPANGGTFTKQEFDAARKLLRYARFEDDGTRRIASALASAERSGWERGREAAASVSEECWRVGETSGMRIAKVIRDMTPETRP